MLSHREEVQYLRDIIYIEREKELQYMQDWEEWQESQQKEAEILVIKEEKVEIVKPNQNLPL